MKQPAPPSDPDQREGMSITDPTVMRALAHPVRMALIELFGVHPTLTATQASEALGESPANCAFHLRTLAKYGFVEEAGGGRGRERPWKASTESLRIRLRSSDLDSEQARVAAGALEQVWFDRWFARIREVFVNRRWSPAWENAAGSSQTLTFLTPEEVRAMRDEINAIVSRHLDERREDRAKQGGPRPGVDQGWQRQGWGGRRARGRRGRGRRRHRRRHRRRQRRRRARLAISRYILTG
jgi:hypothetical protein